VGAGVSGGPQSNKLPRGQSGHRGEKTHWDGYFHADNSKDKMTLHLTFVMFVVEGSVSLENTSQCESKLGCV